MISPIYTTVKGVLIIKLFVIGNGFDIDHDLECRFRCFKCFLKRTYPQITQSGKIGYVPLPKGGLAPDGNYKSDLSTDALILYRLIENVTSDSDWNCFEEDLGNLPYKSLLDLSTNDDDDDLFHQVQDNEDLAAEYLKSFDNFPQLFTEWIDSIDTSRVLKKTKYASLFSNDDLFLTFNYTDLLENTYGIPSKQICHIHGKIGERLIFGHDNIDDAVEEDLMAGNADIYFNDMHRRLYKDTTECIDSHRKFLSQISTVDEIYFLGWSMAAVDIDYLSHISKVLHSKHVKVHFTKYDEKSEQVDPKTEKLKKYGFNFSVSDSV